MNTWLWGPPLWRILHSVSFAPDVPRHHETVTTFLETFQYVLPCVYCRESYTTFITQLQTSHSQSLSETVKDGGLARWMYELHNKVNDKLGVCRHISFECLVKRHTLRPTMFSPTDVWDVLCMFALNYTTDSSASAQAHQVAAKHTGYAAFLYLLPFVLHLAGADERLTAVLREHPPTMPLFDWAVACRSAYEGRVIDPARERQVYTIAQAKKCQHGSCV